MESLLLAGPAGRLEALLEEPEEKEPVRAALVCHPHPVHGGSMHNKVVYRLARGFRAAGTAVLRFNFRGVGRSEGSFGQETGELEDARAALDFLRERYPSLPWLLAGFSFGSRIVQRLACPEPDAPPLVLAGFPAVSPDADSYLHCPSARAFIHSTRDQFGTVAAFQRFYDRATGPRTLVWIEAQDHFFTGALDRLEDVAREAAARA